MVAYTDTDTDIAIFTFNILHKYNFSDLQRSDVITVLTFNIGHFSIDLWLLAFSIWKLEFDTCHIGIWPLPFKILHLTYW